VKDPSLYHSLMTHGLCYPKTPNDDPWCASCLLEFAVGNAQAQCPVYVGGGSAESTTGSSESGSTALFDGNKSMQLLFTLCVVLGALLFILLGYVCFRRFRASRASVYATR